MAFLKTKIVEKNYPKIEQHRILRILKESYSMVIFRIKKKNLFQNFSEIFLKILSFTKNFHKNLVQIDTDFTHYLQQIF